jgi:hypothetical protein
MTETFERPAAAEDKKLSPAQELKAAAQEMRELALKTLKALMEGEGQHSVKLAAAREVLDRGFGKPQANKRRKAATVKPAKKRGLTVIVKRFSDVTPEEKAAAEATKRGEL